MAFKENVKNGVVWMTSDKIKTKHGFSTRYGGVSGGGYESLNMGFSRGDKEENANENHRRFGQALGLNPFEAAFTKQVHGTDVRIVGKKDAIVPENLDRPECDGLASSDKNLPLYCFTADCVPVLLHDPENEVIAAVHAGWRSSVNDILGEAVQKMKKLGACENKICAAIGPAIGTCCFEISEDVKTEISRYLNGDTDGVIFPGKREGKYFADLREANKRRLIKLGLNEQNIDVSDECTMCKNEKYWSHRYVGQGERGSQCATIVLE